MEVIQHTSHDHKLTFHEFYERPEDPLHCRACCKVISGSAYICNHDYYYTQMSSKRCSSSIYGLHKSCAELPTWIQHSLHPQHRLRVRILFDYFSDELDICKGVICDICRHYSWGFCYICDDCKFKLDLRCAFNDHDQSQPPLKRIEEKVVSYHEHKLQLFYLDGPLPSVVHYQGTHEILFCCCCLYGFKDSGYGCSQCKLFIHETCLDIPQQVQRSIYPHPLRLETCFSDYLDTHSDEPCRLCSGGFYFSRIFFRASSANAKFHVICGKSTTRGLRVKFHQHNMFYTRTFTSRWNYSNSVINIECQACSICKGKCDGTAIYSCMDCRVSAHIECIPLPRVIKHECDLGDHPLILIDSIIQKNNNEMYNCDICEKEGYFRSHLYYCEECNCTAHIECALSEEYPPLEVLEYLVPRNIEDESKQQNNSDDEKTRNGSDEVQEPDAEKEEESQSKISEEDVDALDEEIEELTKRIEMLKAKRILIINQSSFEEDVDALDEKTQLENCEEDVDVEKEHESQSENSEEDADAEKELESQSKNSEEDADAEKEQENQSENSEKYVDAKKEQKSQSKNFEEDVEAEKEKESQLKNYNEDVDALDEEIKNVEIMMAELAMRQKQLAMREEQLIKRIELLKAKRLLIIDESS